MRSRKRPPTSPGRMLRFFMEESNVSFKQLEKHLGWPPAQLEKLLDDKIEINIEIALDLADTWGNSVEYWLNVQKNSSLGHIMQNRTPLPSIY